MDKKDPEVPNQKIPLNDKPKEVVTEKTPEVNKETQVEREVQTGKKVEKPKVTQETDVKKEKPLSTEKVDTKNKLKELMKDKRFIIGFLIFLFILVFIIVLLFLALFGNKGQETEDNISANGDNNQTPSISPSPEENASPTPTQSPSATPPADDGKRKIAYMKDNNIWIVSTDGTGDEQITNDGNGMDKRYTAIDWKSKRVLSYARCDSVCKIYTYQLSNNSETEVLSMIPFTQNVSAIEWSHNGSLLAYIFTKGDSSSEASVWNGSSSTSLQMFAPVPARGGMLDDKVEIEFSPDDSRIVLVNTLTDLPSPSVGAYKPDGTVLITMGGMGFSFPTFDGNDGFYYKDGNTLKYFSFPGGSSSIITAFVDGSAYNFKTSPDRNFISYWWLSSTDDVTLVAYDVAGSPVHIANGFVYAKWLDSLTLVAIKTDNKMLGIGPISYGLYQVQRVGGANSQIVAGSIYEFEIEDL